MALLRHGGYDAALIVPDGDLRERPSRSGGQALVLPQVPPIEIKIVVPMEPDREVETEVPSGVLARDLVDHDGREGHDVVEDEGEECGGCLDGFELDATLGRFG